MVIVGIHTHSNESVSLFHFEVGHFVLQSFNLFFVNFPHMQLFTVTHLGLASVYFQFFCFDIVSVLEMRAQLRTSNMYMTLIAKKKVYLYIESCHILGCSNVTRTWVDAIKQCSLRVCSENYFLLLEFENFADCKVL
jgi:hypothetical protein